MSGIAFTPCGNAARGHAVTFTFRVPRAAGCTGGTLHIYEPRGEWSAALPFAFCDWNGTEETFACTVSPPKIGLFCYYLLVDGIRLGLDEVNFCPVENGASDFYLTVYEKPLAVPAYLAGGVMYQIFPDRFFRKGDTPTRPDAHMHACWDEQPFATADERGVVRNNDFFGGTLQGIESKLPYLAGLGVTALYLNPIFEAYSNHRYDTADYETVDPLLGTNDDFTRLCAAAKKRGIAVILDGVFSHTGSVSRYFNKDGRYPTVGAFQSTRSPYYPWYTFTLYPNGYACWWDFPTLPNVNELEPSYADYICGENGIVRTWLRRGAAGWRLDVADELPDAFIERIAAAAKAERADAFIYGEVWEDAATKVSYGVRRRYLLGSELGSVMNYPVRDGILRFVMTGDPTALAAVIRRQQTHYPPHVLHALMNVLSTHDTPRALTVLGDAERLKVAAALQFTLYGVPTVFYGDEAGMTGGKDPLCRGTYPWGNEDHDLIAYYKKLAKLRKNPLFTDTAVEITHAVPNLFAFRRVGKTGTLTVAARLTPVPSVTIGLT